MWNVRVSEISALTRAALCDDRLRLVSEPIVSLSTGEPVADELLLALAADRARGSRPSMPSFSRLCELDAWIVRRAARVSGPGRPVHVRVSADSVCTPDFIARAEHAIAFAGANPARITLDIAEEVVTLDPRSARAFCESACEAGIPVALADVGLRFGAPPDLPAWDVRALKIDPWSTRRVTANESSRRTVSRIVEAAKAAGIESVAAGPVDDAAIEVLRAMGVDCLQGATP